MTGSLLFVFEVQYVAWILHFKYTIMLSLPAPSSTQDEGHAGCQVEVSERTRPQDEPSATEFYKDERTYNILTLKSVCGIAVACCAFLCHFLSYLVLEVRDTLRIVNYSTQAKTITNVSALNGNFKKILAKLSEKSFGLACFLKLG